MPARARESHSVAERIVEREAIIVALYREEARAKSPCGRQISMTIMMV
jgi:hypothetical protein